jgi:CHAD domain-containing protein
LHELRKELKKLRYAADMLAPIFAAKRVEGHLKALKRLAGHLREPQRRGNGPRDP